MPLGLLAVAALAPAVPAGPLVRVPGNVAGGGCTGPDADGDGVPDPCDNCPNTPGQMLTPSQDVDEPIPEPASTFTCGTITDSISPTISVSAPGIVFGVKVSVTLQHQTYSDVDIQLQHEGMTITLNAASSTSQARNPSDLNGTYRFEDGGAQYLGVAADECFVVDCPVVPPGTYRGDEPLGVFWGMPAQGDWTLIVSDTCRFQSGTLISWSLELDIEYP